MDGGPRAASITMKTDPRKNDLRFILGAQGHGIIDLTDATGPVDVPDELKNCRWYEVDVGGVIKFDYQNDAGQTFTAIVAALEGANDQFPGITRVYHEYASGVACDCQVYNETGVLVPGIRLVL